LEEPTGTLVEKQLKAPPAKPLQSLLVIVGFLFFYRLVKAPFAPLEFPFYDDGETLYHAFAVLQGLVPYRDDVTHHFFGYVLPYIILGKIIGVHQELLSLVATICQVATAFVLYKTISIFAPAKNLLYGLLGGMLFLTAREPFVIGFSPLYEVSFFMVLLWYLSVLQLKEGRNTLSLSFFIAGLAFTFDQRALILVFIPFISWLVSEDHKFKNLLLCSVYFLLCPILALAYLHINGALNYFYEQTIAYPLFLRGGSANLFAPFSHLRETPFLVAGAAIGIFGIFLRQKISRSGILLILLAIPPVLISLFGRRDFDYYTIPLLPLLALWSAVGLNAWGPRPNTGKTSALLYRPLFILLITAPILAVFSTCVIAISDEVTNYRGDGSQKIVHYINNEVPSNLSLFVWGYRPDIYVRTKRVTHLKFVNRQLIHPDAFYVTRTARQNHVYFPYEIKFKELFLKRPPDFILLFKQEPLLPSFSDDFIQKQIEANYSIAITSEGATFGGTPCGFELFRRNKVAEGPL